MESLTNMWVTDPEQLCWRRQIPSPCRHCRKPDAMCRGPDTAQTRPRSEPRSEYCVSRGATPQHSISPFHPNAPYNRTAEREVHNKRGRFYFSWSQVVWQHSYISNSEILWSWARGKILSNTCWLLKCICNDWLIRCCDERAFFFSKRTSQSGLSVNRKGINTCAWDGGSPLRM